MNPKYYKYHAITLDQLAAYFHLSIEDAAKSIGVSTGSLKKVCRKFKIERWPRRKLNSLIKKQEKLRRLVEDATDTSSSEKLNKELQIIDKQVLDLQTKGYIGGPETKDGNEPLTASNTNEVDDSDIEDDGNDSNDTDNQPSPPPGAHRTRVSPVKSITPTIPQHTASHSHGATTTSTSTTTTSDNNTPYESVEEITLPNTLHLTSFLMDKITPLLPAVDASPVNDSPASNAACSCSVEVSNSSENQNAALTLPSIKTLMQSLHDDEQNMITNQTVSNLSLNLETRPIVRLYLRMIIPLSPVNPVRCIVFTPSEPRTLSLLVRKILEATPDLKPPDAHGCTILAVDSRSQIHSDAHVAQLIDGSLLEVKYISDGDSTVSTIQNTSPNMMHSSPQQTQPANLYQQQQQQQHLQHSDGLLSVPQFVMQSFEPVASMPVTATTANVPSMYFQQSSQRTTSFVDSSTQSSTAVRGSISPPSLARNTISSLQADCGPIAALSFGQQQPGSPQTFTAEDGKSRFHPYSPRTLQRRQQQQQQQQQHNYHSPTRWPSTTDPHNPLDQHQQRINRTEPNKSVLSYDTANSIRPFYFERQSQPPN